eukprot:8214455-Pyramimonas_sp.AAC.1
MGRIQVGAFAEVFFATGLLAVVTLQIEMRLPRPSSVTRSLSLWMLSVNWGSATRALSASSMSRRGYKGTGQQFTPYQHCWLHIAVQQRMSSYRGGWFHNAVQQLSVAYLA